MGEYSNNNNELDDVNKVGRPKTGTLRAFRKGQSGNPKGRPKGAISIASLVIKCLDRKITRKSIFDKAPKRMAVRAVVAERLIAMALKGSLRAIELLLAIDAKASDRLIPTTKLQIQNFIVELGIDPEVVPIEKIVTVVEPLFIEMKNVEQSKNVERKEDD